MNRDIPSIQPLSLVQDEFPHAPAIEPPIDHTALGDRVAFRLRSEKMAAFVATLPPEQQEALEVQIAQQRAALRLQEKRKARQMTNDSITATARRADVALLDLPPETLTHILFHLPFTSVVICKGVNRHLHVLISESAELQYFIHLGIYGMVDNPHSDLPISERLNRLLTKQRHWEQLDPDFYRIIDVPVVAECKRITHSAGMFSALYEGGVLRRIQIPSEANQEVEWKEYTVPFSITAGRRVLEQDLEIVVTARPRTVYTNAAKLHTIHEVQVHFSQLSTGEPHPDVQRIISFETRHDFEEPWISTECIGDNLVLVLRDEMKGRKPDDQVYVFEWKAGELKMTFSAPWHSYMFPLFLTAHTFLLPNATTGELEYWKIPRSLSDSIPDQPFFILSLPPLVSGNAFQWVTPHAGPPLTLGLHTTSRPFYADPRCAIVCFDVCIKPVDGTQDATGFAFFVHRSSLVGCLDTFSALISSDGRPTSVPYGDWGPSACRWFNDSMDDYIIGWTGGVFGQKYTPQPQGASPLLLLNFNPTDVAKALVFEKHILGAKTRGEGYQGVDVNGGRRDVEESQEQRHVEKGKEVSPQLYQTSALGTSSDLFTQGPDTDPSSFELRLGTRAVIQGLDPLDDPYGCFENTVYSSLPYTARSSRDKYDYEQIYMVEDYILGTKVRESRRHIEQLHVLHYG